MADGERRFMVPEQPTPLIGRERDVEEALQTLMRSDVRLLTLTGAAGIGKTRLALEVAHRSTGAFAGDVCFVNLVPISDPEFVETAIAQALNVRIVRGQTLSEALRAYLQNRVVFLILDNFEQVLPSAVHLSELLAACPGVKLLVTSREALRLRWEHVYPVPLLEVPDLERLPSAEELASVPSIALFVERARARDPDFNVRAENARAVAEICVRLDGLPLAIELAAAHADVLRPEEIVVGLCEHGLDLLAAGPMDVPARHRTLRESIAWSYNLLSEDTQTVFARLAVFVGGCTWEAAQAVCGDAVADGSLDVSLCVADLVRSSLLRRDESSSREPRLRMLATIREYALEQLSGGGNVEVLQRRHAYYFADVARQAEDRYNSRIAPGSWLDYVAREYDNFRAALRWCHDAHSVEAALQLGAGLCQFWAYRGFHAEGRDWLARILALSQSAGASAARARILVGAGTLAGVQSDYLTAEALYAEGLASGRAVGDHVTVVRALNNLGVSLMLRGELAKAKTLLEEGLALAEAQGERGMESTLLDNLSTVAYAEGDLASARSRAEAAHIVASELGHPFHLARALGQRGRVAYVMRDLDSAQAFYEQALAQWHSWESPDEIAVTQAALARVAMALGQYEHARSLLADSLSVLRAIGDRRVVADCLDRFAELAVRSGQADRALRLAGAAAALREAIGTTLYTTDRLLLERALAPARASLGQRAEAAWAAGRSFRLEEAIELALAEPMPASTGAIAPEESGFVLTPREREVACLVAEGLSNREIGERLVISPRTAENYLQHVLNKLGLSSRAQIAAWAVARGLHRTGSDPGRSTKLSS